MSTGGFDADNIPGEVKALIDKAKIQPLGDEDRKMLAGWYQEAQEQPGFSATTFRLYLTTMHGYNERLAASLLRLIMNTLKKVEATAAGAKPETTSRELEKLEKQDLKDFIGKTWSKVKAIGEDVVLRWTQIASQMGYYNAQNKDVDLLKFMDDALTFFQANRDTMAEREEMASDDHALIGTLLDLTRPTMERTLLFKSYTQFLIYCHQMAIRGFPVPEALIADCKREFNEILYSIPVGASVGRQSGGRTGTG